MTPDEIENTNIALRNWRQGDVALTDELPAIHLADLSTPGTQEAEELAHEEEAAGRELGLAVVSRDFFGFMVVSQTCDIVRSCSDREFVEICPLIEIENSKIGLVRAGRMPRYLSCSGLGSHGLAADLERVTTLEKRVLARLSAQRITGAANDIEQRRIASALARKRARAALPDDFVKFVAPLQKRVKARHGKDSEEGRFLTAVREIRVVSDPNWGADHVDVTLLFLFDHIDEIPSDADTHIAAFMGLVAEESRFTLTGFVRAFEQITAATYLNSDALDLDALSDG